MGTYMINNCRICDELEKGDTIYMSNNWDGGVGYDYIRDIQYCPCCGKPLLTYEEKSKIWREEHNGNKTDI